MSTDHPNIIRITGKFQHYAWGGTEFLPELMRLDPTGEPFAEYWLGNHPSAPSSLAEQPHIHLNGALKQHGVDLNFLFKVLDIQDMLSIQVHPSTAQAQAGFAREEALGIPRDAPHRNYRDAAAKPEMLVALYPVWLLHGFASADIITNNLASKTYLAPLLDFFNTHGLRDTFALVLRSDDPMIASIHQALLNDLPALETNTNQLTHEYWIARWLKKHPNLCQGILCIYLMNLVWLDIGQSMTLPEGMLHAYLQGQAIELMGNSDNVLRAGLTPKHIDVEELLTIANIHPSNPKHYLANAFKKERQLHYKTEFDHLFQLSVIGGDPNSIASVRWTVENPEILFCFSRQAEVNGQPFKSGDALLLLPGAEVKLNWVFGGPTIYRAVGLA